MLKLCALFGLTVMVFLLEIYSQTNPVQTDATDLLKILRKVANESIGKAKSIMDAAAAKVESTGGFAENEAEMAFNTIGDGLKGQLEAIKEMAADADIDECLAENEEKLMNMPHEFYIYFLHNVSYKVMEGVSHAIDVMKNANDVYSEISDFEQILADCESDISSTNCFEILSGEIEETIVSLPNKIRKLVKTGVALTDEACTGIGEYLPTVINDLEAEGGVLVTTIFECVDNIIK